MLAVATILLPLRIYTYTVTIRSCNRLYVTHSHISLLCQPLHVSHTHTHIIHDTFICERSFEAKMYTSTHPILGTLNQARFQPISDLQYKLLRSAAAHNAFRFRGPDNFRRTSGANRVHGPRGRYAHRDLLDVRGQRLVAVDELQRRESQSTQ